MRVLPATEMLVTLDRKEIVITADGERFAAAPILLLGPPKRTLFGGSARPVLEVGRSELSGTTELSVHLFDFPRTAQALEENQAHYLATFFRYAVESLIKRFLFKVKPRMRVSGLAGVEAVIDGNSRDVIRAALFSAGAQTVEFE